MTPSVLKNAETSFDWRPYCGWLLVGFALGGFFDGILLHQILQWHHLLSGFNDPLGSDLHFQIMMDGIFHLLMYLVAIVGILLLVSRRPVAARFTVATGILRQALIGFAIWHIADAVLSHWLIGLHRIRMDSDMPLVWDVAWLIVFGILPLVLAYFLPPLGGSSRGAAAAVITVTVAAGLAAGAGPHFIEPNETIIVFRKGLEPAEMTEAVLRAGASVRWSDVGGTVWAVDHVPWRGLATLYANGALMVGSTPAVAGCLAWTRPA